MPCYTRTTVKVEIESGGRDIERLREAAAGLGYSIRVTPQGRIEVQSATRNPDIAALKREYAALTVKAGLKRFGWKVQAEARTQQQIELLARR